MLSMVHIYVKRSRKERLFVRRTRQRSRALLPPGSICNVRNNEPHVHYYDAFLKLFFSVLHHGYRILEKCV